MNFRRTAFVHVCTSRSVQMTARTTGIALALVLCGTPLYAAETKSVDKSLPLSALGTVTLDAHNGSIQIRTWDRAEVEVHVRIEARGDSAAARRGVRETAVAVDGSADVVSITSRTPEIDGWGLWDWLVSSGDWDSSPDIHYSITAPRTARWRIRNHNARADIRDVNASLEVATHNGSVWVANQGGPLELSMHNGDAHVDFVSFTQASHIATHNGAVELTLPASARFDLHSRGHRMRLDSDFPATVRASDFGRHSADAQVNGGGPELRLSSHNGGFRLRSK